MDYKCTCNNDSEPKICGKPAYKCAVCDKIYDTIEERAKCESECIKKQLEKQRLLMEEKKREQKNNRKKEVDDAIRNVEKLIKDYIDDYGEFDFLSNDMMIYLENYPFSISKYLRMLP